METGLNKWNISLKFIDYNNNGFKWMKSGFVVLWRNEIN